MIAGKQLKAKAAETHGLLLFATEMLCKYKQQLIWEGNDPQKNEMFELLSKAGESALAFDKILSDHDRQMGEQPLYGLCCRYNEFALLCSRAVLPKNHLMYHCIQRAQEKGNPRVYSTYIHESYNGAIAKVCRSVHRRTWAISVYRKLEMLEAMQNQSLETLATP